METCEVCDGPLDEHFGVYTTCEECGRICGPCCDAGDRLCAPCAEELAS